MFVFACELKKIANVFGMSVETASYLSGGSIREFFSDFVVCFIMIFGLPSEIFRVLIKFILAGLSKRHSTTPDEVFD